MNVGELDEQVNRLPSQKNAVKKTNGICIDVGKLGYDKLLGGGKVTRPLIVRVASHSRSAASKITEAKGRILQRRRERIKQTPIEEEKLEVMAPEIVVKLAGVRGIGPKRAEQLKAAGINSVRDLASHSPQNLAEEMAVSERTASK